MAAMLPAPSTPRRTLSITPSLSPAARLRVGSESPPVPSGRYAIVVVAEHGTQNGFGVLADCRGLGRVWQGLADEVQRGKDLICAHLLGRQEREAVGELWIIEQGPGRIDGRDGGVDPSAELEPLLGRL